MSNSSRPTAGPDGTGRQCDQIGHEDGHWILSAVDMKYDLRRRWLEHEILAFEGAGRGLV